MSSAFERSNPDQPPTVVPILDGSLQPYLPLEIPIAGPEAQTGETSPYASGAPTVPGVVDGDHPFASRPVESTDASQTPPA